MSEAAASYQLPQLHEASERQALDESLINYMMGTKLYTAQLSCKAKQVFVRVQMEVLYGRST